MAAPLTPAAVLLDPELLPSEPAAEFDAPGNGVIKASPLVVKTTTPRLAIAGATRSSSMQSNKLGFNRHCRFIDALPQRINQSLISPRGWTDRSVSVVASIIRASPPP